MASASYEKHNEQQALSRPLTRLLDKLEAKIQETDLFDLSATLTLLLVLLHGGAPEALVIPFIGAAFVFARTKRHDVLWLALATYMATANYFEWFARDNHKYLINYWCIAVLASCYARNCLNVITFNARMLIGLSFLFATIWKFMSHDFMNGTFFYFTLLEDSRFADVAKYIGGMTEEAMAFNSSAVGKLISGDISTNSVQLTYTPMIGKISTFLTWWTIAIESLVAVAFLAPGKTLVSRYRDVLLLLFIFSTYSIATVVGFASLLIVMGFVQSNRNIPYLRVAYLAAFVAVQVYSLEWSTVLRAVLGSA